MSIAAAENHGTQAGTHPGDVVARIAAAPVRHEPFAHLYAQDVFAPLYYRELLRRLPAIDRYRELQHRDAMRADGTCTRRKFYLFPEYLQYLPAQDRAFWRKVSHIVLGPAMAAAFKQKFRTELEQRFGRPIARLSFCAEAFLVCDLPGYRIPIHADDLGKAITVQFYLPCDHSQAHLGTHFHDGDSGEAADRIRSMVFAPASAYAFPVLAEKSWHSVPQTRAEDGERNSLMLIYYVQDRWQDWLRHRLRRLDMFLGYRLHRNSSLYAWLRRR